MVGRTGQLLSQQRALQGVLPAHVGADAGQGYGIGGGIGQLDYGAFPGFLPEILPLDIG